MTDPAVDPTRSRIMRAVRGVDTKPEMAVRKALHARGYRFRLHDRRLRGSPDIVMRPRMTAIFVHGCFWHRHDGCRSASVPKTRPEFWAAKFERNVRRDAEAVRELEASGWRVVTVWECDAKVPDRLAAVLDREGFPDRRKQSVQGPGA